jgi:hypothetical protein
MSQNEIADIDFDEVLSKQEEQRIKDELNHPNFKTWFKGLLHECEVNLVFYKKSGEERHMRCTLQDSEIPADKQPKGTGKATSEDTVSVFDTEIQDWRSFRFDSIKEFEYDLPEDSEYPPHPEPVFLDAAGVEYVSAAELTEEIKNAIVGE